VRHICVVMFRHKLSYIGHVDLERIILKYVFKIMWEGVEWIYLAQNGKHWRAVVNTAMNLRVP
jgi:hypothetical protein